MSAKQSAVLALLGGWLLASPLGAYPLDDAERTGITRLEGYRLAQDGRVAGLARLPAGARLASEDVRLRLADRPELELPQPDAALGRALGQLLGAEAPLYGVALLDVSDADAPRYAEHRGEARFSPGSVGKLLVALAVFQTLADLYPDDAAAREAILRDALVIADALIRVDSHEVPFWRPGDARISKRPLRVGDAANLWTYLDWMLSASSNAAASMVIEHLLLLRRFGVQYPPLPRFFAEFLNDTPRRELSAQLIEALQSPVTRNGLDLDQLRQGGFFTAEGKRRIPGSNSAATAREMVRFLLRLEQGRLVDAFSSLEMKRLLYQTDRRIRYASSPALEAAAVYFKSGSLYRCRPEPDFQCRKYHGNVENVMNSVAIVESPAGAPRLHYLVAVTSNVLRKNSAVEHQTLATRIHRLIEKLHPLPPPPPPLPPEAGAPQGPPPPAPPPSGAPPSGSAGEAPGR